MALKDTWIDQNNEKDVADAGIINEMAHAIIDIEKNGGSGGAVSSVNGHTGDVNLTASDVGAARNTLSNVSDKDFLAKLNAVLPDGDEVSY
jgi:hypothetical protein